MQLKFFTGSRNVQWFVLTEINCQTSRNEVNPDRYAMLDCLFEKDAHVVYDHAIISCDVCSVC